MDRVAILGGGKIGRAIASGLRSLEDSSATPPLITHHREDAVAELKAAGFQASSNNAEVCRNAELLLLCVQPGQALKLLEELRPLLDPARHVLVSIVTGLDLDSIAEHIPGIPAVQAMPNTAIELAESMTCIAGRDQQSLERTARIFSQLGSVRTIPETHMTQATALCACGVAFFLRAIRAASQGGIEIGFHAEDAIEMAAQTARGAASLLLEKHSHPEHEIDRVTTPTGCTIAGLNRMEHQGFSSAMIRGIITSAEKAQGGNKKDHND